MAIPGRVLVVFLRAKFCAQILADLLVYAVVIDH